MFKSASLFVVFLWFLTANVFAESPPASPLAAEVFFRDPDVVEALISPSGKRLAITAARSGARIGLFILDLSPGGQPVHAAQFTDVDVRNVAWVHEDRLLFSVVDFTEGVPDPNVRPGLFAVNADGSEVKELISRKHNSTTKFGTKSAALDPNHLLLKVLTPKSESANEEVLVGKLIGSASGMLSAVVPLWLNVTTGKTRATNFQPPRDAIGWLFDGAGVPRVVVTRSDSDRAAYWRGPDMTEWKKIVQGDLIELPFTPHSVDDVGNLYVTQQVGPEGYAVLKRFDFATMQPASEPLVSTPGFDFAGQLMLERGTGAAQGVRVTTDAETTVWFDEAIKKIQDIVDRDLPGHVNRISCRRCGLPDAVVLVRSFSDQSPGRLLIYRPTPVEGQPQWQPVAFIRRGIDAKQMARVDFKRIQTRDGKELPLWITQPQGVAAGKPAPAVVLVHGGPWVRGGSWAWNPLNQFLASRGYLVIEPEFRGSRGYGATHFKSGWKQWGQAMQDDVADALLWAQREKLASGKACIAGGSYGGYSTLMGLIRHPDLYRCGMAWIAVTDLHLLVKGSWWVNDDTSALARKHTIPEMVGDAEKDADMLAANSPVLLASQIRAPLLLAFGEEDKRVPLAHGTRLREAMQKASLDPEWVTYPQEGHGWSILKNKIDFANRIEGFLAKHLPVQ